jgi:hypothetical protein
MDRLELFPAAPLHNTGIPNDAMDRIQEWPLREGGRVSPEQLRILALKTDASSNL